MKAQPAAGRGSKGSHSGRGQSDWADPGYFGPPSLWRNTLRLMVQLLLPPRGHRITPTFAGAVLILLTFVLGSAALNTAHNVLYIALAMVLSSLIVSGLLSWFNLKGCRWRLSGPDPLRVDEPAAAQIEFHNGKSWLPAYGFHFGVSAWSSDLKADVPCPGPVGAGQTQRFIWDFRPTRRGPEQLKLEALMSSYPFGFLKRTIRDSVAIEMLVWPARCDYRWDPPARLSRPGQHGQQLVRGEGAELARIRSYSPGDALNRVHWKASARTGRLLVKELNEPVGAHFHIEVDASAGLWKEASQFERMCSFVGSLAEDLFRRGELASWSVAGAGIRRVRNQTDIRALLDALSTLDRIETVRPATTERSSAKACILFRPGAKGKVKALLAGKVVGDA
ncbi:MAG: DUF58 domain-containing protein [Opitutales bacterium]|nr:DUF58 domain-containing protein [Opitutales bacterium]